MARTEQKVESSNFDRMRVGKTQRDHASGAWARRMENQDARGEWSRNGGAFPGHTCNGRRYYRGDGDSRKAEKEI